MWFELCANAGVMSEHPYYTCGRISYSHNYNGMGVRCSLLVTALFSYIGLTH